MSRVKHGATGEFTGRIGDVVVYRWRKLRVGRSKAKNFGRKPPTAKQMRQQTVFGELSRFLGLFVDPIKTGFNLKDGNIPPYSYAVKYNAECAALNAAGEPVIDFEKIQFSKGNLDHIYHPSLSPVEGKNYAVRLDWMNPQHYKANVSQADVLYIQLYSEAVRKSDKYSAAAGYYSPAGKRGDSFAEIKVQQLILREEFHCWLFLASADGKQVSKTKYLGLYKFPAPEVPESSS